MLHLEKLIKFNLKGTGIVQSWASIRTVREKLYKNTAKNEKDEYVKVDHNN